MHIEAIIKKGASDYAFKYLILFCFLALAILLAPAWLRPAQAARSGEQISPRSPWADEVTGEVIGEVITGTTFIHLPYIALQWPPAPPVSPKLNPIQNSDGDNFYTVTWSPVTGAASYTLEVSPFADFRTTSIAYEGTSTVLSYPQGQLPASYYYRVKANNPGGSSPWSEVQSVTIYPLHVGLNLRWDSVGYAYILEGEDIGAHEVAVFEQMVDEDTVRMSGHFWYSPNPEEWEEEYYKNFYSISTGEYKYSEPKSEGDSSYKWGYSWLLAYGSSFEDGDTVDIGGEPFTVHGPIWGNTKLGYLSYWEFTNQDSIILYDDGEGFVQAAHPGDVVLRYETGPYGMLVYDLYRRNFYFDGEYSGFWVRYITELTSRYSTPAVNLTAGESQHDPGAEGERLNTTSPRQRLPLASPVKYSGSGAPKEVK